MKQWKTILVTAVIALLVVALGLMAPKVFVSQESLVERDANERIRQYEIIAKEQRLITEILTLKYNAALIQSKFQSTQPASQSAPQRPPNNPNTSAGTIESMEFIPIDQIPPDAKVSDGLGKN